MGVIELSRISKEYRSRRRRLVAVEDLSLEVPEGGVFALLGPNGAGKTTTLRCILGLVRPTTGTVTVMGCEAPDDLWSIVGRVGSMVEGVGAYGGLSGRRNLELLGRIARVSKNCVENALERVGLHERGGDKVSTYSTGMRQRLGLAAALLKDPALLVLDEPTNGLDPAGIVQMRGLLRDLGTEGRTVLVSSHMLSEVGQVADRLAILVGGKCVFLGDPTQLLEAHDPGRLVVFIDDMASAATVLTEAGFQVSHSDGALSVTARHEDAPRVAQALAAHGLFPLELRPSRADLEDVFLSLTSPEPGDDT